MLYITNKPHLYEKERLEGHDVVWECALNMGAKWIITMYPERGYIYHGDLSNTQSGPCTILGYGPSRLKFNRSKFAGPVFAINRSIEVCPDAEYWCCHDRDVIEEFAHTRPKGSYVLTQGCQGRYPSFEEATKGMKVVMVDAEANPSRWPMPDSKPLYWNETTFGWALHLAIRMGFTTINTIGIDLSLGGYKHPKMDDEELKRQHEGVRERILRMFEPSERLEWYDRPARLVDYSGGLLPVEKATL